MRRSFNNNNNKMVGFNEKQKIKGHKKCINEETPPFLEPVGYQALKKNKIHMCLVI